MKAIASNGVEINTGDAVLVRDYDDKEWMYAHFSHHDGSAFRPFVTSCDEFSFCIPYNGNEHLVGTTDNYVVPKKEKKPLTYQEKQERWINKHNIKVGDKVKITKASYENDNGWDVEWLTEMNKFIKQIVTIDEISMLGISFKHNHVRYYVPYHILEKVENTPEFRFGAKIKFAYYGEEKEGILLKYEKEDEKDKMPYFVAYPIIGTTRSNTCWVSNITYID